MAEYPARTNAQNGCRLRVGQLAAVGVSLAAIIAGAPAVSAQTTGSAPSAGADTLETIVVTSRKKAENLQDVPLTITAFSAKDLQAAGVQDLRDLTFLTPGLTFNEGAGANYYSKPIIRGQTDIGGSPDNNVPVFLDGIYISNSSVIDFGLIDLARIEVIEGPVSATYGRSAYAGAINYVTAKPTNTLTGYGELTGGDYGKVNVRVGVSGPLIQDVLKGGVSFSYDRFDGTYHDKSTGQNANGYEKKDVLVNLDYTPNEHLEIRPVVYYGDDFFDPAAAVYGAANCSVGLGYGYSQSYCGKVPGAGFIGPQIANDSKYGATGNQRKVLSANLQTSLKYDWGTLSSLTGYGHYITNEYVEFSNSYGVIEPTYYLPAGASVGGYGPRGTATGQTSDLPLLFGYTDHNVDVSEELRYSSPQKFPIRTSFGAYYASSSHYNDLNLAQETCGVPSGQYVSSYFAVPCGTSTSPQQTIYTQNTDIYAGFISADWDILKNLTLSTEVRESADDSSYKDISAIFTPFPTEGYSTSTGSSLYPIGDKTLSKTFWSVTSRTALTYKPTPELTTYISAANGEKVGGFNNSTLYPTYNPETNWTYEIGAKSTLLDHHLQLNGDFFFIEAQNYQISGPPPNATLPGSFITTNYGGLSTTGVEASANYIYDQHIKLSAGLGYSDPKFRHDAYDFGDETLCSGIPSCAGRIVKVGPNEAVALHGLSPPYASKVTFNTALELRYPSFGGWDWTGRVDYRFESKQYYQYPIDTGYFGPKNIVNLRTGFEKGPYSAIFYVRNLLNDKTPLTVQDSSATGASPTYQPIQGGGYYPVAVLPDGTTVGVTLRYKFGG